MSRPLADHAAGVEMPIALGVSVMPAVVSLAVGVLLVFVVGFLQVPAVHNGAHDTRHANGFPCH